VSGHLATNGDVTASRVSVQDRRGHIHVLTDYLSERNRVQPRERRWSERGSQRQ
jgi:hypothetical protein